AERACTLCRSAPRRESRTPGKRRSVCDLPAPPGCCVLRQVRGCTFRSAPPPSACGRTGEGPQTRPPAGLEAQAACQSPLRSARAAYNPAIDLPLSSCATDTNPDCVSDAPASSTTMDVASGAAFCTAAASVAFTAAADEPQPVDFTSSRSVTTPSSPMETRSAFAA